MCSHLLVSTPTPLVTLFTRRSDGLFDFQFNFTVERVSGGLNTWADFLTHWAAPGNSDSSARRTAALRVPLTTEDLPDLPSLKVIAKAQTQSLPSTGSGFTPLKESNLEIWKNAQ